MVKVGDLAGKQKRYRCYYIISHHTYLSEYFFSHLVHHCDLTKRPKDKIWHYKYCNNKSPGRKPTENVYRLHTGKTCCTAWAPCGQPPTDIHRRHHCVAPRRRRKSTRGLPVGGTVHNARYVRCTMGKERRGESRKPKRIH